MYDINPASFDPVFLGCITLTIQVQLKPLMRQYCIPAVYMETLRAPPLQNYYYTLLLIVVIAKRQ